MIHAKDDYDIPWCHTRTLRGHAVSAIVGGDRLQDPRQSYTKKLGATGSVFESRTENGVIRE